MPSDRDFFLVGVTGGIGSGKSAVCGGFQQLGRTVLSADGIAREIMEREMPIKKKVQQLLGAAAYTSEGILDRQFVADRVFTDPASKKKLDAIVHPAVFREIENRVSSLPKEQRTPYVIVEAALIYESGLDKELDYVIVVEAGEETRIQRVMQRDKCSRDQVLRRIAAQMPPDEKSKRADFVIRNDSSPDQLPPKIRFIDHLLTQMVRAIPASEENSR
jgi:dephospho-CoA kinase